MSTNSQTPGQIAKTWAKAHREFVGALMIQSVTRKGKGGRRGFANRSNNFFVRDGEAAQSRQKEVDSYSVRTEGKVPGSRSITVYAFNGLCSVCGTLYLDPVLQHAWMDDPAAGEPIDVAQWLKWPGYQDVVAEKGYVRACPTCLGKNNLLVDHDRPFDFRLDRENHKRFHARPHPSFHRARFAPRLVQLDARNGEPYTESELLPDTTEYQRHWRD